MPPPKNLVARVSSHPVWLALSADIFTGQIIASLIVLTFVAVFLLREWISQNARPGVFEEEELPADEPPPAQPPRPERAGPRHPPIQPLIQGEEGFPIRAELNPQQIEAIRALEAFRHRLDPEVAMDPNRWEPQEEVNRRRLLTFQRKKYPRRDDDDVGVSQRRRITREDNPDAEMEAMRRKVFHRHINVAKAQGARHRSYSSPFLIDPPSPPLQLSKEQSTFAFTFRPQSSAPEPEPSASTSGHDFNAPTPGPSSSFPTTDGSSSPFPSVTLQPSGSEIPFSLTNWPKGKAKEAENPAAAPPPAWWNERPPTPNSPPPSWAEIDFEPSILAASTPSSVSSLSLPPSPSQTTQSKSKGKAPMFSSGSSTFRDAEEMHNEAGPSTFRFSPGFAEDMPEREDELDATYDLQDEMAEDESNNDDGGESNFAALRKDRAVRGSLHQSSSESDIDMETERNRYFKAAEEAGRMEPLLNATDSDDSEDDGEDHDHGEEEGADDERGERDDDDDMFREEDELEVRGGGLFFDEVPWEEDHDLDPVQPPLAVGGGAAPGVGAAAPGIAAGPANPVADAGAAGGPDLGDEPEVNGDDDLEGAMEGKQQAVNLQMMFLTFGFSSDWYARPHLRRLPERKFLSFNLAFSLIFLILFINTGCLDDFRSRHCNWPRHMDTIHNRKDNCTSHSKSVLRPLFGYL